MLLCPQFAKCGQEDAFTFHEKWVWDGGIKSVAEGFL